MTVTRRGVLQGGVGLAALAVLGACQQGSSSQPDAAGSGGAIGLKFWTFNRGGDKYIASEKQLAETYSSENPGTTVTWTPVDGSSNNWYQLYTTAIASGTGPDLSSAADMLAFQFYPQGQTLEIDDVVAGLDANDYYPGQLDAMKFEGHYLAVPTALDVRIGYYRKDLFEKAGIAALPKTFDDLRAAAEKLRSQNVYGFATASDGYGWQQLLTFFLANGGGLFAADQSVTATSPENQQAATFLSELAGNKLLAPGTAGFSYDDAFKSFASGQSAMYIGIPGIDAQLTDLKGKLGVMEPFAGPSGDPATLAFINNIFVFKSTKNADAAKKYLNYYVDNQLKTWTEGAVTGLPARKSFAQDPYFADNPTTKEVLATWVPVSKGMGTKYMGSFPQLSAVQGNGVMITLTQDILRGTAVEDALGKAQTALEKTMKTGK